MKELTHLVGLLALSISIFNVPCWSEDRSEAITPPEENVSTFEAEWALARNLAHLPESQQESATTYAKLVRQNPQVMELRHEYALLLVKLKNFSQAAEQLQAILKLEPKSTKMRTLYIKTLAWNGESVRGFKELGRLPAQTIEADPDLLAIRGSHLRDTQAHADALRDFLRALAVTKSRDKRFPLLKEIGSLQLMQGDLSRAADFFKQALTLRRDDQELRKKIALTHAWMGDHEAAIPLLQHYADRNDDYEVKLTLARSLRYQGRLDASDALYTVLTHHHPKDLSLLTELAEVRAAQGRYEAIYPYLEKALQNDEADEKSVIRLAQLVSSWGDQYYAESILSRYIETHKDQGIEAKLALARLLHAMERYVEARALVQQVRSRGVNNLAVTNVENLLRQQKHHAADVQATFFSSLQTPEAFSTLTACRERASAALSVGCSNFGELILNCIYNKQCSVEPQAISSSGTCQVDAPTTQKVMNACAKASLQRELKLARVTIQDVEPADSFYRERLYSRPEEEGCLRTPPTVSAETLVMYGDLYVQHQRYQAAEQCYLKALSISPHHVPAQLARGQILLTQGRQDEALSLYSALAKQQPHNRIAFLQTARILSWKGDYEQALNRYAALQAVRSTDPVVAQEKARVFLWAGEPEKAVNAYSPEIFHSYSSSAPKAQSGSITPDATALLESHALQTSDARQAAVEKRYRKALNHYEEALSLSPHDPATALECGQAACASQQAKKALQTYEKALENDPTNPQLLEARSRLQSEVQPSVGGLYYYWSEEGRGELARITRHRYEITGKTHLSLDTSISASALHFQESPDTVQEDFGASGVRIGAETRLSDEVRSSANLELKNYEDELDETYTGSAAISYRPTDDIGVNVIYQRANEIHNIFSLRQDLQSDAGIIQLMTRQSSGLMIDAEAEYRNYDDNNALQRYSIMPRLDFDQGPGTITVGLTGEYRDVKKDTIFVSNSQGSLANIIHPYWTPDQFYLGALSVGWTHYLGSRPFCLLPPNRYSVTLTAKDDAQGNFGYQAEAAWRYELMTDLRLQVQGVIHRSQLWDADSALVGLEFSF